VKRSWVSAKSKDGSWASWHTLVIPFRRLWQENHKFEANLEYIVKNPPKINKNKVKVWLL
jgi:hypothetical protein